MESRERNDGCLHDPSRGVFAGCSRLHIHQRNTPKPVCVSKQQQQQQHCLHHHKVKRYARRVTLEAAPTESIRVLTIHRDRVQSMLQGALLDCPDPVLQQLDCTHSSSFSSTLQMLGRKKKVPIQRVRGRARGLQICFSSYRPSSTLCPVDLFQNGTEVLNPPGAFAIRAGFSTRPRIKAESKAGSPPRRPREHTQQGTDGRQHSPNRVEPKSTLQMLEGGTVIAWVVLGKSR